MRSFWSKARRRGTVSMEYVIILGTSIIMAGLATGTAIRSMQFQAAADLTAAAMTADFTQAAAEETTRADTRAANETGLMTYGPYDGTTGWSPLVVTATVNTTVEPSSTTPGPVTGAVAGTYVLGTVSFP